MIVNISRIVDTNDVSRETVVNDLVPRSLPVLSSATSSSSGITIDRGNGKYSHLRCIADSPVIVLSESSLSVGDNEETLSTAIQIPNSTICDVRIHVDVETKHFILSIVTNVSIHWIIWKFPANPTERLISNFPVDDDSVFSPHRSFVFGNLISNTSVSSSSSCLVPSESETMIFFNVAFENARALFIRAPFFGCESNNIETFFIEPTSLFSRIMSYASSSQASPSVVSVDCFTDFDAETSGTIIFRKNQSVELYTITDRKKLSNCGSGPATFSCIGSPIFSKVFQVEGVHYVGILHRNTKQLDKPLVVTICKISNGAKLSLTRNCEFELPLCGSNVSVIDFGVLPSFFFVVCETSDGNPVAVITPTIFTNESIEPNGPSFEIQYWRRPISSWSTEEIMDNEAEILAHSVLSSDCGAVQLLRQLLQSLRLPHMGPINSNVMASGIATALTSRQDMNASTAHESSSKVALEMLSRKIENIWSKDRKILGVYTDFDQNYALIYHRHSVAMITPSIPALPYQPKDSGSVLLDRIASEFYNNFLACPSWSNLKMFESKDAVIEFADSFLITLEDDIRFDMDQRDRSSFDDVFELLIGRSIFRSEQSPAGYSCEAASLDVFANSFFYRRAIAQSVSSYLDWIMSYAVALLCFYPNESERAEQLAQFSSVVKSIRSLLEQPMPVEENLDELTSAAILWLGDGFVEYSLNSEYIKTIIGTTTPSITSLSLCLAKVILPQNGSFVFEQFLLDSSFTHEFESLQQTLGSAKNYPATGYRLYLYGLNALLKQQSSLAMEYFIEAALFMEEEDAKLMSERCRSHLPRTEPKVADFWIRILDLAQHFGNIDVSIEAANRAKAFYRDETNYYSKVLDMKLFKLQCQDFNFRDAIRTLLNMKESEDQQAAVNVIVSTAIQDSKLQELMDCLLIEIAEPGYENIFDLVGIALAREFRTPEGPDWNVSWSLYRMCLNQNKLRDAAAALFEYAARFPFLPSPNPEDFKRRRDSLALAHCTLSMLTPVSEQWLHSLTVHSNDSQDAEPTVVTLQMLDEFCKIESARVELINACELPNDQTNQMEMDNVIKRQKEDQQKPKFEEVWLFFNCFYFHCNYCHFF